MLSILFFSNVFWKQNKVVAKYDTISYQTLSTNKILSLWLTKATYGDGESADRDDVTTWPTTPAWRVQEFEFLFISPRLDCLLDVLARFVFLFAFSISVGSYQVIDA